MAAAPRYRVESDRSAWVSVGGPDYECEGEHRVVEIATGRVVLRLQEWGDWPFMVEPRFTGVARVELAEDGTHAVVTDHEGKRQVVALS
jgi:hypothetical protein